MTQRGGASSLEAAKLNNVAAFGQGNRRIDYLKSVAYACNFSDSDAKPFGKLSRTATWEALLNQHGLEFEQKIQITPNTVETATNESPHQISLMQWVDFQQLLALALASVTFAVLFFSVFPRVNPLNLLPVKITIQIGDK
ncbi:hypothetical protein QUA43_30915 [Microcoleus sp. N9_B4]|uniref:hypothetical protein n=1 Tax=Microcoleus sp. N9_B4 TaxID=3055386 RepID=UPI002FD2E9A5